MIKFTILLRKRADLSQDEFVTYHQTKHAPLFLSLPEVQQHVRRYVQCHSLPLALPGMPPQAYDGITELWFDNEAAMEQVFMAERYLALVRPDEATFLDMPAVVFWYIPSIRCCNGMTCWGGVVEGGKNRPATTIRAALLPQRSTFEDRRKKQVWPGMSSTVDNLHTGRRMVQFGGPGVDCWHRFNKVSIRFISLSPR